MLAVNNEQYRTMVTNFLWARRNGIDLTNMWIQQYGGISDIEEDKLDVLNKKLKGFVVLRDWNNCCVARSSYLTPLA